MFLFLVSVTITFDEVEYIMCVSTYHILRSRIYHIFLKALPSEKYIICAVRHNQIKHLI